MNNSGTNDSPQKEKEIWRVLEDEERVLKRLHVCLKELEDRLSAILQPIQKAVQGNIPSLEEKDVIRLTPLGAQINKQCFDIRSIVSCLENMIDRLEI